MSWFSRFFFLLPSLLSLFLLRLLWLALIKIRDVPLLSSHICSYALASLQLPGRNYNNIVRRRGRYRASGGGSGRSHPPSCREGALLLHAEEIASLLLLVKLAVIYVVHTRIRLVPNILEVHPIHGICGRR